MKTGDLLAALVAALGVLSTVSVPAQVPNHEQVWLSQYNEPGNFLDFALAAAVSPDGMRLFVTGMSESGENPDQQYATVAYDTSTGTKLWDKRYNGVEMCVDAAEAIAVSHDGTMVFVTGYSGCVGYEDFATIAYEASSGKELWVSRYDAPAGGVDYARAIAVSADGTRVFVTGESDGFDFVRDYGTVAYDATTGREVWASRYAGPGEERDEAFAIGVSPNGDMVFVTGQSYQSDDVTFDYVTIAYDAAEGSELWLSIYNGSANVDDVAESLAVSPDGLTVFVSGHSFGEDTFSDYATVAYDTSNGHERWVKRHDGPASGFDVASAIAVSPDGARVFVTGYTDGAGISMPDYTTIAYNAESGERLWLRSYDGPGKDSDLARSIAVSPDGAMVFVTGDSVGTDSVEFPIDYATLAYDAATGQELWLNRYNGPANRSDVAEAAAISPNGSKLFVTGSSYGTGSNFDFVTMAYDVFIDVEHPFLRADCNRDGAIDISDAVFTLDFLFLGGADPACNDAFDSNDDGALDISDAVAVLGVLFLGQGEIPPPGPNDCGNDPTDDPLDCRAPPEDCG